MYIFRGRPIRGILFDLFHTLVAIEEVGGPYPHELLGVEKEAWHWQCFENSRERLIGKISDPMEIIRGMAHAIDPAIPEEKIIATVESRVARFAKGLSGVGKNVTGPLETLRTRGLKLALVSNADEPEIRGFGGSPLAPLFDAVVFSCEAGHAKPEPEIYEKALRRLSLVPEECLFVGDGGSGELIGARKVGLTPVLTTQFLSVWLPEKIGERRNHADFEIGSLQELLEQAIRD